MPFEKVEKYLQPYSGELKWHAVHRDVGNVRNDRPDLVAELKVPKGPNKITNFFSAVPKSMCTGCVRFSSRRRVHQSRCIQICTLSTDAPASTVHFTPAG